MKIGTVGTNFVVDNFVDAVKKTKTLEIGAVYSRGEDTATTFAQKHGVAATYTDKDAFLRDDSLDFIYVASPNSLHYQWAKDALNAGRGVICEKPFVPEAAQLEELMALAKEKGLFLYEAVTVPHLPNFKLLKEHLAEVGDVRIVQLNFSQYSSRYDAFLRGENPNVFSPQYAGGALMDLNYYNLNFLYGLFGQPQSLQYFPNVAENGIDTSGILLVRYPGFVCTAVACKDSVSQNSIQIQGTKGYIHIPSVSSVVESFTVQPNKGEAASYNQQPDSNVLTYEVLDFEAMVNSNDTARCNELLEHSLAIARLVEKARKAAGITFPADS